MREIKFRQALYRNGKFYKFGYWGFGLIDEPKEKFFMPEISVWEGGDGSIDCTQKPEESMQFTGLKDKNGREIFEGDIVSWGGSMYGFGKVVYERYSFLVKYKLGEVEDEMYFNHPDAYTIIGNIYETPELLTTPK